MRSLAILLALAGAAREASADPRRFVVSTEALEVAEETFGLALDYRLAQHAALRAEGGYDSRRYYDPHPGWNYRGSVQGAFGIRGFLQGPYQGAFADVELRLRTFRTSDVCNTNNGGDRITVCYDGWMAWSPRLSVGWQHTFAFGLSLAAAAGIGYEWVDREDGYQYTNTLFVREIRVGYAF